MLKEVQVRSKARTRDLGEVLTAKREVNAMLDLLPKEAWLKHKKFYEPACGNGNFLAEILKRKLAKATKPTPINFPQEKAEFEMLLILASVYGTDICRRNVVESRDRLRGIIKDYTSTTKPWNTLSPSNAFKSLVGRILEGNIVEANALDPKNVTLSDWAVPREGYIKQEYHLLMHLQMGWDTKAITSEEIINFYQLRKITK
jgi:hypothetical protein